MERKQRGERGRMGEKCSDNEAKDEYSDFLYDNCDADDGEGTWQ